LLPERRREPTKREKVINEKSIQVLDGQEEHRLGREEEEEKWSK
jgi:hypothetical protein